MSGWQAGHSRYDGNHYTSTIQYNGTTLLFGNEERSGGTLDWPSMLCSPGKGQIKTKADWRAVDSPKK